MEAFLENSECDWTGIHPSVGPRRPGLDRSRRRPQTGPMLTPRKSVPAVTGLVVLISGAGSGIGAGTAVALGARGARLVLSDVDEVGLRATEAAISGAGGQVVTRVADVRDLEAMEAVVRAGVEAFGGIDAVVANAGIGSFGSVLKVDPEAFRRVVEVNLLGVFHTVRAALPSVIERRGYVLVVSSLAAFTAAPGMASYNASKAGAENFANALRLEVAHLGVDVGSAHMSWIDTPMVQEIRSELSGFEAMISRLPPPLNRTTDLAACVDAFVTGIAQRRRRIFVPGWVAAVSRARTLVNSPFGQRQVLVSAAQAVDETDADVASLGRSLTARIAGQAVPPGPPLP